MGPRRTVLKASVQQLTNRSWIDTLVRPTVAANEVAMMIQTIA